MCCCCKLPTGSSYSFNIKLVHNVLAQYTLRRNGQMLRTHKKRWTKQHIETSSLKQFVSIYLSGQLWLAAGALVRVTSFFQSLPNSDPFSPHQLLKCFKSDVIPTSLSISCCNNTLHVCLWCLSNMSVFNYPYDVCTCRYLQTMWIAWKDFFFF